MKKRSHLSDSSLLHLAAPFKNTLYSLLRLKLHLTDSMMESPILPPFLALPLLSLELLLCFHPSCQQSSRIKKKKKKAKAKLQRRCKSVDPCAYVDQSVWELGALGVFWHGSWCISVCMFNRRKGATVKCVKRWRRGWWWWWWGVHRWACSCVEVRTGVPEAAGRPVVSELIRSSRNHPAKQSIFSLLYSHYFHFDNANKQQCTLVQPKQMLLCCSINTHFLYITYCCLCF